MDESIEYGVESSPHVFSDGTREHIVYRISKVTVEDQVKVRVKNIATFTEEQTAYDFCDVWRGRSG